MVGGQRVSKGCERLESYGTIDELNSHIGVLITYCTDEYDAKFLVDVQIKLLMLAGNLATDTSQREIREGNIITTKMVEALETEIDRIKAIIPPLKMFVLPGGSRAAAYAHVCRTVCRRAERCIARLVESGAEVDEEVMAYVNRLSDYLFVLARKLNADDNVEEITWKRK